MDKWLTYVSGGLLGDFIHQLSVINENYLLTGKKGDLYMIDLSIFNLRGLTWKYGVDKAYDDIKNMVINQEYILDFSKHKTQIIGEHNRISGRPAIDLSAWRGRELFLQGFSFYEIFKKEYNIEWGSHTWLKLKVNPEYCNTILISTNELRYNQFFDYSLLEEYNKRICFATTDINDFLYFKNRSRYDCRLLLFDNLEEFWIAINSCYLFVGTMSSFLAVAHACHKNNIILLPTINNDSDLLMKNFKNSKWYKNDKENNL